MCSSDLRQNTSLASFLAETREAGYTPFGDENFSVDDILHEKIEDIAYRRKRLTLNKESRQSIDAMGDDTIGVLYSWYTMSQLMRRSNFYNILALRMKLQLLGLDYTADTSAGLLGDGGVNGLTQKKYFDLYAKECKPRETRNPDTYRGAMYDYDNFTFPWDYRRGLPRRNLCVQEHYRWNAYMIRSGFIPMTRAEIESGLVKDYTRRRKHANLSSFEALFEFREIRAMLNKTDRKEEDVIGYDYKLLDEAWFFLNACGYEIVQRQE